MTVDSLLLSRRGLLAMVGATALASGLGRASVASAVQTFELVESTITCGTLIVTKDLVLIADFHADHAGEAEVFSRGSMEYLGRVELSRGIYGADSMGQLVHLSDGDAVSYTGLLGDVRRLSAAALPSFETAALQGLAGRSMAVFLRPAGESPGESTRQLFVLDETNTWTRRWLHPELADSLLPGLAQNDGVQLVSRGGDRGVWVADIYADTERVRSLGPDLEGWAVMGATNRSDGLTLAVLSPNSDRSFRIVSPDGSITEVSGVFLSVATVDDTTYVLLAETYESPHSIFPVIASK